MESCNVRAYAKINLSLAVVGKRNDGYHLIKSKMQALSLHDDVIVETTDGEGIFVSAELARGARYGGDGMVVNEASVPDARCDGDGMVASVASHGGCALPQGEDNLAYAAAELSLRLWGENNPSRRRGAQNRGAQSRGARITIRKRIPMAAGLAGGSSDAAAVMLALARALAPDARLSEVIAAGASIGADVPFCVAALAKANPQLGYSGEAEARSSALCEGIGDVLSQTDPASGWAVLIKPAIEVSTPEIYAGWDALAVDFGAARTRIPDGDDPAPESVPSGDDSSFDTFRGATPEGNDLAVAAVQRYPLIGDIMDDVRSVARADRVFMTGSGPTIVALYADETKASRDCSALSGTYKDRADIDAVILSKLL